MAVLLVQPYWQFFDSNGDPLVDGLVYTYEAGTDTPKATYTDRDEGTELDNPIELDSAGRVVAWGTGSYKFIVKDSLGNTIETVDNVTVFNVSSGNIIPVATAGGTVNAITADYTPDVTLVDKTLVSIVSSGANTSTAPTFTPDGNTTRTIVKAGGVELAPGDIGASGSAHMLQYDLSNTRWELLNPAKYRDTVTSSKTSAYTVAINDDVVPCNATGGAFVVNLLLSEGKAVTILKTDSSTNKITITPPSGTINGLATMDLAVQYQSLTIVCDGTNFYVKNFHPMINAAMTASTSGTSIDFTGIPANAKKITVMLNGVSTSGTSLPLIQIGYSGGIENTGYVSESSRVVNASGTIVVSSSTAGYVISSASASNTLTGAVLLTLMNAATNTWCAQGNVAGGSGVAIGVMGSKSVSGGVLDRVRLTTTNGSDTFDAGNVNISYEI